MQKTIALRTVTLAEQATVHFAHLRAECTVTLDIRPIWSVCGRAMTFAATVAAVPPGPEHPPAPSPSEPTTAPPPRQP